VHRRASRKSKPLDRITTETILISTNVKFTVTFNIVTMSTEREVALEQYWHRRWDPYFKENNYPKPHEKCWAPLGHESRWRAAGKTSGSAQCGYRGWRAPVRQLLEAQVCWRSSQRILPSWLQLPSPRWTPEHWPPAPQNQIPLAIDQMPTQVS